MVASYTVILLPFTYFFWPSGETKGSLSYYVTIDVDVSEQNRRKCLCQACQVKRHVIRSQNPGKKLKRLFLKFLFIFAWALFAYLLYQLSKLESSCPAFDPFSELEIDKSASLSEIRKAYKSLSLKYHPDKSGDERKFIQISRAYAAYVIFAYVLLFMFLLPIGVVFMHQIWGIIVVAELLFRVTKNYIPRRKMLAVTISPTTIYPQLVTLLL
ncbi:unnamed protein product [Protopolystoma xenopodis]|uniref:J domain-containing protein n=1 Tax=Protopolystoma xenopodis TaxID=117903 RepID=A0A448XJ96_9PLAT|nr:unnamed protein product [Protopolystoma xenopodis]